MWDNELCYDNRVVEWAQVLMKKVIIRKRIKTNNTDRATKEWIKKVLST